MMRSRTAPLLLVLPLVLGLSACAGVAARTAASPGPSPAATPQAGLEALGKGGIQAHPPSPIPARPTPVATDVAGAAAIVRARVTGVTPRLLPAAVPAGVEEATVTADSSGYTVQYTDDTHARTITFTSSIPLGINGPHQSLAPSRSGARTPTTRTSTPPCPPTGPRPGGPEP